MEGTTKLNVNNKNCGSNVVPDASHTLTLILSAAGSDTLRTAFMKEG